MQQLFFFLASKRLPITTRLPLFSEDETSIWFTLVEAAILAEHFSPYRLTLHLCYWVTKFSGSLKCRQQKMVKATLPPRLLRRAVGAAFLPLSPHCAQAPIISPIVFHGAWAWQSPNATHRCFRQQENSWVSEWMSRKIAFYDLLVQLALRWRPAAIVWTVCNKEGIRKKYSGSPSGM